MSNNQINNEEGVYSDSHKHALKRTKKIHKQYTYSGRYICNLCNNYIVENQENYYCYLCNFDICDTCMAKRKFVHDHPLKLTNYKYKNNPRYVFGWQCIICKEMYSRDLDSLYCKVCENDYCEECLNKAYSNIK